MSKLDTKAKIERAIRAQGVNDKDAYMDSKQANKQVKVNTKLERAPAWDVNARGNVPVILRRFAKR